MQFRLSILAALVAALLFAQNAKADPPSEKSADKNDSAPTKQLSQTEQIQLEKEEKARREALRKIVVSNITLLLESQNLTRSQSTRVTALLGEQHWDTAVDTFVTGRETEIQEYAHNVAKTAIPGMMRKFMPSYMQKKMMAQRRAQKRRGPPSREDIASIQKDAQSKMRPAMQKIVMPNLESLTETRLGELANDEKTMTRVIGDRILKSNILGEDQGEIFEKALDKAGYPASLTTGEDSVLNDRMKKMIDEIDIAKVAASVGL